MEEKKIEQTIENGMSTASQKPPKFNLIMWYIIGGVVCMMFLMLLLLAFNKSQPVYNTQTVTISPTITPIPSITESQAVDEIQIDEVSGDIEDLQNDTAQL